MKLIPHTRELAQIRLKAIGIASWRCSYWLMAFGILKRSYQSITVLGRTHLLSKYVSHEKEASILVYSIPVLKCHRKIISALHPNVSPT